MMGQKTQIAVFGGGCFWCTEAVFEELKGVISVMSGYASGTSKDPTYEEVTSGKTGHAEVIQIEFNPALISYEDLLTVFFATHDPTTLNRQGLDVGTQYRSIILYITEQQKITAQEFIDNLNKSETARGNIVTQLKPLEKFYKAEEYHRQYYLNNPNQPYCQLVINPKLEKLKERFYQLLKKQKNN